MSPRKSQAGFSVVELFIVAIVVVALAMVGYTVYNRQNDNKAATTTSSQSVNTDAVATDVPTAPAINSTSDLDKASAALDQIDPSVSSDSDVSQIDSQLANF